MTTSKPHGLGNFVRASYTAEAWLGTVAHQLGTEDRHYAYRVLRAWLHTVRDRVTVDSAAHFAAGLPVLQQPQRISIAARRAHEILLEAASHDTTVSSS